MHDDDALKGKEKRFYGLPTPKHAEQYSLEECAKFQPWKVILKVEVSLYEPEPIDYEIFCRAQSPDDAQWTAYHSFMVWEHLRTGLQDHEYPKVSENVQSEAFKLSESQYKEAWKEAQTYPHAATGDRRNPSIFRFAKPGWKKKVSRIVKPESANIIVPDKSMIDKVERTRNRQ